ncbi:hypothetical protein TIFTF001_042231, partial [Ficus carica]
MAAGLGTQIAGGRTAAEKTKGANGWETNRG